MGLGFTACSIFLHLLVVMYARGSGAREMIEEHLKELPDHSLYESSRVHKEKALRYPVEDGTPKGTNVLRLRSMGGNEKDGNHVHRGLHGLRHERPLDEHVEIHDGQNSGAYRGKQTEHVHSHSSSHMDHMDPSVIVFFMLEDLKVGKTMPIYFPKRHLSPSPPLLPREEADTIPFSSEELPKLLQLFSFSQGSPQARAMEDTLRQCESAAIKGETKFCATSLESMLDFARAIFGQETQFRALATTHLAQTNTLLQNYTVMQVPLEIPAPKMVACHTMPYPYAVFYCHSQKTKNKVFKVSLVGENGDGVEAVAVCHTDTSQWSRNHLSFRVLGIEPGTFPVCHFFPWDNFVWIPLPTAM